MEDDEEVPTPIPNCRWTITDVVFIKVLRFSAEHIDVDKETSNRDRLLRRLLIFRRIGLYASIERKGFRFETLGTEEPSFAAARSDGWWSRKVSPAFHEKKLRRPFLVRENNKSPALRCGGEEEEEEEEGKGEEGEADEEEEEEAEEEEEEEEAEWSSCRGNTGHRERFIRVSQPLSISSGGGGGRDLDRAHPPGWITPLIRCRGRDEPKRSERSRSVFVCVCVGTVSAATVVPVVPATAKCHRKSRDVVVPVVPWFFAGRSVENGTVEAGRRRTTSRFDFRAGQAVIGTGCCACRTMKTMADEAVDAVDEQNGTGAGTQNATAGKEFGQRTLRSLKKGLGRLWRRHRGNASITEYDPCYKVAYLGNVLTGWAKGEGCVEKPVSTLWRNYVTSNRPDVSMRLTVTNGGLTATTKDHGLTEYWAHRVTYCTAPASHPRLFVWVYRHEGRRLRPELRCHAALCSKESTARRLASTLNARLQQALLEFRRDKVSRQNARLSLANALYENPSLPRRKLLLSTGGQNYRPPLERSKSAPKLSAIEEDIVAEEIEQQRILEELRTLETVARSWHDQDSWRLARLLDALNRESSDENGSISSGCETASTATSEERAPGPEDNHAAGEPEQRSERRVMFSDDVVRIGAGPRRNSDGSPNFMTCAGSPRFHLRSGQTSRKRFSARSEEDESMEEEDEEMEDPSSHVFDFEDAEDFDDVVDYRPRGEILRRIEDPQERERRVMETYPGRMNHELLQNDESPFLTLDSLDEEVDSDESGYVEAPPKSLLGQDDRKEEDDGNDGRGDPCQGQPESSDACRRSKPAVQECQTKHGDPKESKEEKKVKEEAEPKEPVAVDERIKDKERERADFIKCPISETIKKLANASLKSSKSLEITTNSCLKALNNLKTSKSFDGAKTVDIDVESPSLHQRKQLLAQHGVVV